jgi:hypothetical protein
MFTLYPHSIPRCQHIKVNGTQCGSPALRRNRLCYFHKTWQGARIALGANRARRNRAVFDLPLLEDANSIQLALMQVMRLILSGQIDGKTAGLLLYALQTASSNLARTNFEPTIKTRVVIDPRTVDQTPLGEDPWNRDDYREQENEDDDQEEACEQVQGKTEQAKAEQAKVEGSNAAGETIANIEGRADDSFCSKASSSHATRPERRPSTIRPAAFAPAETKLVLLSGKFRPQRGRCVMQPVRHELAGWFTVLPELRTTRGFPRE